MVFTVIGVPGNHVLMAFFEGYSAKAEPKKQSGYWEEVLGWNEELVDEEKAVKEMDE